MAIIYGNTITADGTLSKPFKSPAQAALTGAASGTYYFQYGSMSAPQQLQYENNYYGGFSWVAVFRSAYNSPYTLNKLDLAIPMKGLLVQRDALDIRAAVYWRNPQTYVTTPNPGNDADGGYAYQRVFLGYAGGHGIYNNTQQVCGWSNSVGAVGAGWDGSTCGADLNSLRWGTGQSANATYTNLSGTWSHWVTW